MHMDLSSKLQVLKKKKKKQKAHFNLFFGLPATSELLVWGLELKSLICVTKKKCSGFYEFLYAVFIGENW